MDEPSKLPGLEAMPPEDQKAIGATLSALLGGFSKRDAAMLEAVYSDDADWVNAFGAFASATLTSTTRARQRPGPEVAAPVDGEVEFADAAQLVDHGPGRTTMSTRAFQPMPPRIRTPW